MSATHLPVPELSLLLLFVEYMLPLREGDSSLRPGCSILSGCGPEQPRCDEHDDHQADEGVQGGHAHEGSRRSRRAAGVSEGHQRSRRAERRA